ncbi:MAG: 5'/3'-nucleotidase SurE [Acidobacteria bacterium]|jgi:5'-nucleotidase|nr:5'/3'-nucleotidase SurE [Acidobacteriota bacterium]
MRARVVRWSVAAILVGGAAVGWAGGRCHVMIANDDGIDAPGIEALARVIAADPSYRVTVVAPAQQQSGVGHALTLRELIRVEPHAKVGGAPAWAVDATPATTVRVGIDTVLADDRPDIVLSGINRGENVGLSDWYSGTLGAAREATVLGVPAIAFSLGLDWGDPHPDFTAAARWVKPLLDAVRDGGLPRGVLLNVNIPKDPGSARGYRLTRSSLAADLATRYEVVRQEDGVRWLVGHWSPPSETDPTTDAAALADGWVTITPLNLDQTDYRAFPALDRLMSLNKALPTAPGK